MVMPIRLYPSTYVGTTDQDVAILEYPRSGYSASRFSLSCRVATDDFDSLHASRGVVLSSEYDDFGKPASQFQGFEIGFEHLEVLDFELSPEASLAVLTPPDLYGVGCVLPRTLLGGDVPELSVGATAVPALLAHGQIDSSLRKPVHASHPLH